MIAYIITKRICLGLQRKDNHLLEHGVETGIIRQLPGGEFIEETRPVDENSLAVLTSRIEHPPLPAVETAETDVPAPGMRGALGKVRERLYNVVTESARCRTCTRTVTAMVTGTAMAMAAPSRETATARSPCPPARRPPGRPSRLTRTTSTSRRCEFLCQARRRARRA